MTTGNSTSNWTRNVYIPMPGASFQNSHTQFISGESITGVVDTFDGLRPHGLHEPCRETLATLNQLIFLSASRQVDTDLFPVPEDSDHPIGDVGPIGQFATWWFHQEGDNPVSPARSLRNVQVPTSLRHQVNAWAADLFPGVEFNALPITGTSQMLLEIKSGPTSGWTRPANIGYGISYAFSTLVAGLTAPVNGTLIIDSPEAHLHPRGQARIGRSLARYRLSPARF